MECPVPISTFSVGTPISQTVSNVIRRLELIQRAYSLPLPAAMKSRLLPISRPLSRNGVGSLDAHHKAQRSSSRRSLDRMPADNARSV